MKFSVTAPDRSSMGFNTYCCAGRHWPGGRPVIVETVDQDECPRVPHPTRQDVKMLDPVRIGRIAWKEISEDPMLSKNAAPETAELSLPPTNPNEQLREDNRKLRETISDLDRRLKLMESKLAESLSKPQSAPASTETDEEPQGDAEKTPAPEASDPSPAQPVQARNRRGKTA